MKYIVYFLIFFSMVFYGDYAFSFSMQSAITEVNKKNPSCISADFSEKDYYKAYQECVSVIKKYPYSDLLLKMKKDCNWFVLILFYNEQWGMYPSYIYSSNSSNLDDKTKKHSVIVDEHKSKNISELIGKYIDFKTPTQFISYGKNSLPAMFKVVVVYKKDKVSEIILGQVSTNITDKYINNQLNDNPFLFIKNLADITNTDSMCESIYGFIPVD